MIYHGWPAVIWNKAYSLMLSAGSLVHKKYIQVILNRFVVIYFLCCKKMYLFFCYFSHPQALCFESKKSLNFRQALADENCQTIALNVIAAHLGAPAPIWVPLRIKTTALSQNLDVPTDSDRTACLNSLVQLLGVNRTAFSYSKHKAADARNEWFW
jgi:hypothetical protein